MQDILTGNRSSSEGRAQPDKALVQEDLIPVLEGLDTDKRVKGSRKRLQFHILEPSNYLPYHNLTIACLCGLHLCPLSRARLQRNFQRFQAFLLQGTATGSRRGAALLAEYL